MTDLEQLSRDAAKVLLHGPIETCAMLSPDVGKVYAKSRKVEDREWLHESTEACAEIMVRVLWAENVTVVPLGDGAAPCNGSGWIDAANKAEGDPMQAFRTAVLLALIEVKK